MFRYLVKTMSALYAVAASAFCACSLVDLREVTVRSEPVRPYAVLDDKWSPVRIRFAAPMDRGPIEEAFRVEAEGSNVEGDICWDDSVLSFTPHAGWLAGIRYRMILSGVFSATDGRKAYPDFDVPFFYARCAGAPVLVSHYPGDGASIYCDADRGARIELRFSEPMDRKSVETSFSVQPNVDMDLLWDTDGVELRAVPKAPLDPCATYRWRIDADAASIDGAPLARVESGRFTTDADAIPPRVDRVFVAMRSGSRWVETSDILAEIPVDGAYGVAFSEPMREVSVREALSVSPSLSGRVSAMDAYRFVYIPETDAKGGMEYSITVSGDVRDASGLPMGSDFVEYFIAENRSLRVLSVETDSAERYEPSFESTSVIPILPVTVGEVDGQLVLMIRFSECLDEADRIEMMTRIRVSAFFPSSVEPPQLRSASWPSDDIVLLTWEDLRSSDSTCERFYRLIVAADVERRMETDFILLLEAKP